MCFLEISGDSDYLAALQDVKDRYLKTLESYQKLINEASREEDAGKLRSLYEKELAELQVLQSFLPKEYTQDELASLLPESVKTFPDAMKALRDKIDFSRVSRASLARQLRQVYEGRTSTIKN